MAKSISVAQQQALRAAYALPVLFAEVDWPEGLERYCTAGADMTWNSVVWRGIGDVVSISPIVESDAVEATAVRFSLAGVASSRISQALQTPVQGRRATLWLGVLDPDTMQLIGTPVREFEGRLDAPAIAETSEGGEVVATVSIAVESRLASLLSAGVRRWTDQDQQRFHPGDSFFKFVPEMVEKLIVFPSAVAQRR